MFNKIILVGNLTQPIELKYSASGLAVSKTGIATNRKFKFQDRVRTHLNDDELWFRCAKADGYLQSLKPLKPHPRLNPQILQEEALYWNNFFAITNAVPLRSIISSTAHRAQGMTVDAVAIDYQDLSRSPDKRLLYVALTRAAKQLIVYTGEEHVQQAA